ncbi:acetyltransferase (GNAT) family protein [Humitalea rosea]|uniref:Acetyltransferase (GNAT) family protein n=1 Tax=Humitalea rosea TaxID=990373 RepID=A0A2W7ISH2_9PROT|nr:GNAT family N-acetyltransferase [Humitalea rosea]PZW50796.1 acetyltransferase (GNAT) family protein [Humitalea rosea]
MSLLVIAEEPPDSAADTAIHEGLVAYNGAATGHHTARARLFLTARDAEGRLLGGVKGEVAMDWLYIDRLWLEAEARGQGLGTRLLAAIEDAGRAHGAIGAHLFSSTFQAPGFYIRHGYAEIGRLADRPPGQDRVWLSKRWG